MKLVLAIVNDEDAVKVMDELNSNDYRVTRMCSTGGFLKTGNTTLLVGVEEEHVQSVLSIIESKSKSRTRSIASRPIEGMSYPVEVTVGGATVFVVDVEQFIKF